MADILLKNRRGDTKEYEDVDGVKLHTEDGRAEVFKQDTSLNSLYEYIGKPVSGGVQIMAKSGVMKSGNAAMVLMSAIDMEEFGTITEVSGVSSWFIVSSLPLVVGNVYTAFDILTGNV